MEVLLSALNEFRGLTVALSKAEKKIARSAKDLAGAMKDMPERDTVGGSRTSY